MHLPDPIRDLLDRPAVVVVAITSALGIGMLVLQRWIADTRDIAIVLVVAWFALVLITALVATRGDTGLRRAALTTIGAIAAVTAAVGWWTGFRETTVDEEVAVATTRASGGELTKKLRGEERNSGQEQAFSEPATEIELAGAPISGADGHSADGTATVIERADGSRVLTLTDFEADPGPDVDVYLSTSTDDVDDAVNLGDLKGSKGNQQYEIDAGVDLTRHGSLVLWCHPFTTRIATADLIG